MYQLLARMVTFRANIGQLLGSVRTHLVEASQPRVYNKLSSLLQHASRGILANPTAQHQDLMVFVHGVLEGGLAQEEAAQEAAEAEATAAVRGKPAHSSACLGLLCAQEAGSYIVVHTVLVELPEGCRLACHQCQCCMLGTDTMFLTGLRGEA